VPFNISDCKYDNNEITCRPRIPFFMPSVNDLNPCGNAWMLIDQCYYNRSVKVRDDSSPVHTGSLRHDFETIKVADWTSGKILPPSNRGAQLEALPL
jgi:hypothetical protein